MDQSAPANQNDLNAQRAMARLLLEEGDVAAAHISEALAAAESGGHMLRHLVNAGHLTEGNAHDFLSKQPGIAAIDIGQYNIERGLAEMIPCDFARERMVLPIDALGKLLTVAMACPVDTSTIAEVEAITGRRVKAVLCRASELTVAIEKLYPDREARSQSGFEGVVSTPGATSGPAKSDTVAKLRALDFVPMSPVALQQCDGLWSSGSPSVVDVCDFVSEQPALAAAALRAANAEAFGLSGDVQSVALACAILGVDSIRALAMEAGRAEDGFDVDAVSHEAAICANTCSELARACGRSNAGMLFAAGLMHSIGRLALAHVEPQFFAALGRGDRAGWAQQELQHFGLSFAEAGFELMDAWQLPTALTGAVRDQLDPASSEAHRDTALVIACARIMTAAHLAGAANPATDSEAKPLFDALGLDSAAVDAVFSGIGGAT